MLNNIFIKLLIILTIASCSNAPRYLKNKPGQVSPLKKNLRSKKSKNIKHRKVMSGVSSFYAEDFHGKLTANGEVYDMYGLTAAHKTLPLNTICRVTNMKNNKSLILRINDRGPYIKGRILDCSYGAAKKLGFVNDGTTEVKIEVMEWGDNLYMQHRSK